MLNTILVPLDGSPLAETALEPAMLLAKRCEANLLLVRALSSEDRPEETTRSAALGSAQQYLKSIAEYLRGEGIVVRTAVLPPDAAEHIVDEAALSQVDLIVMATHGRKGLDALLHPSVTWQVLRQTHAPILACKCASGEDPEAMTLRLPRFMTEPRAPILVPLDGSLQSEEALPIAREMAQVFGNPLLLVRAGEQPYIAGGVMGYETIASQAMEWSLQEAESYLKLKAAELASTGLKVETAAAMGSPARFIEQMACEQQAGLIVMASHGRGWLGRLVIGSVAQRILRDVDMPILLVHRRSAPTDEEHLPQSPQARQREPAVNS